jgi:predicted MFS family arabinose efflux permease
LSLPFVVAGLSYVVIFAIALTFKEPRAEETSSGQARQAFGEILKQSLALMHARPALRYPMMYLSLVPLAALILETLCVQPQALAFGVPIAGVGVVVMALQITNIVGSTWSDRMKAHLGEGRILYAAPLFIVASLILLAALQLFPALLFIAVISFVPAALRPILLSRVQNEVADELRATLLSMQSLMFTVVAAISQPTLGLIADQSGLSAAYVVLAGSLSILTRVLFWKGRQHFP